MRDLLVILDSVRYDRFVEATTDIPFPGDVYRAYTHGTWTRPSITSMFSGYLPQSKYGQPYKPSWVMLSPQVFHDKEVPAWFLNANAWVKNMHPRRYEDKFYTELYSAPDQVRDAIEIMEGQNEFFIAILLTETHGPYSYRPSQDTEIKKLWKEYNHGADNGAPELARKIQRETVNHLLLMVKPLLKYADRILITSDHGDLQGENHRLGHHPSYEFHPKLLEVPLVVIEN